MPRSKFQTQQQFDATQLTFQCGQVQGTCNAAGEIFVSHSFVSTPRTVIVTPLSQTQLFATTFNYSPSGSTAKFFVTGSGNIGAAGVTASWAAWV